MKKFNLLLVLASMFTLASCEGVSRYYPTSGGKYVPAPKVDEEGKKEEEDVLMCTYKFYFSYSATTKYDPVINKDEESPILSFTAPMLSPLGECPKEVDSVDKVIALGEKKGFSCDPTFPTFLGFSFNGVCLDETGLWDFTTDYKQLAVVSLYGVWVSNN